MKESGFNFPVGKEHDLADALTESIRIIQGFHMVEMPQWLIDQQISFFKALEEFEVPNG